MIDEVRRVKALIEPEGAWIKHHLARDKNDNLVKDNAPEACKFCLAGAMFRVTDHNKGMYGEMVELFGSIEPTIRGYGVSFFNDNSMTTHERVMRLLDNAITQLEEEDDRHKQVEERAD